MVFLFRQQVKSSLMFKLFVSVLRSSAAIKI